MASYNKVILMGNLTRDPELRVTPTGLQICKFSIAINRNYSTADGERREEVTYVDLDSFGKQAEVISKYMAKGRGIMVEGRLKLDQWDDKNTGEKRSRLGVVVENFQFIGDGRRDSGSGDGMPPAASGNYDDVSPPQRAPRPAARPQAQPRQAAPQPAMPEGDRSLDDDVPF